MTTATVSRPRRPASARGGRGNTARVAYDLGRRGEAAPAWIGDSEAYTDAYERGVSDRDAAEAGTTRHHDDDTTGADVSTSRAGSEGSTDSPAAGGTVVARDDTASDAVSPARRRSVPAALRSDASSAGGWLAGRVDVDDASGLLWGLLAAGMFLAAIDSANPVDGLKAWLRAKFFNLTPATASKAGQTAVDPTLAKLLTPPGTKTPQVPAPATSSQLVGALLSPTGTVPAPKPPPPPGVAQ